MATEILSSNNTFSEDSNLHLDELTLQSDMLLPNQKAVIKVLSGSCDINAIQVNSGDLVQVLEIASVAIRTRFQETVDLNIQYIAI